MNRIGNRLLRSVPACVAAISLSACGAGSHGSMPAALPIGTTPTQSSYTGPAAQAQFKITIPAPKKSTAGGRSRRPMYVSSSTTKIVFTLNSASHLTAGQVTAFNSANLGAKAISLDSATCPGTGPWTCTFTIALPPGTDAMTIAGEDSSNNVLEQQNPTLTVTAGNGASGLNNFSVTLDANATAMVISGNQPCQSSQVGSVFGTAGTSPVTFNVAFTDTDGNTVTSPGLPVIEIEDNTTTYQKTSGTINGTGGTVSFSINQSAQTFTLTPSTSSVTGAAVNVKAVPANSTDGLSFTQTHAFTFSTGPAPPAHQFLAAVEQTGVGSGEVDLYTVSLAAGGPDSFAAYSPSTLAITNSDNQNKPDVDNPNDATFDVNGDLLIANYGEGPGAGDPGNFACVPNGAIASGASTATTATTFPSGTQSQTLDSPSRIAYDSRDGSVALATDDGEGYDFVEYLLSGNYTAAPANRDLASSTIGTTAVLNLPSLVAGSYAAARTNGSSVNEVTVVNSTGSTYNISDQYTYDPQALAWDATNSQMLVANENTTIGAVSADIGFYTVGSSSATFVKTLNPGASANYPVYYDVATSADGHFATAFSGYTATYQIQVYQNNAGATAPTAVGGPIPYNGTTSSCGGNYIYDTGTYSSGPGGTEKLEKMQWLSNTKLLVAFTTQASGKQGYYIYDISTLAVPAGYDDSSCNTFAAAPKQTGFLSTTKTPMSFAYKP